jgi:phosphopantothenoylcysteine decarboxylase/phosphopantothenate--cysteine ligase
MLTGKKILLGVTGGIAAYQAADILGLFISRLADVRVIMTAAATRFIAPLTLETISRHKVTVDMFTDADNSRV